MTSFSRALVFGFLGLASFQVVADPTLTILSSKPTSDGGQSYSISVQVLIAMTALAFLPAILMIMTSFARIIIVLSILRQALGTPQTPSSQILIGLALFMSLFIMSPVIEKIYADAVKPYLEGQQTAPEAIEKAKTPFRKFMLQQTRKSDLELFARLAKKNLPGRVEEIGFTILIPAFITSELKTAFQIGFLIFIPFVVIDLVVASVLMSMGMMMLSPMLVALPFKLMLFVLVDGWALIVGTLAASFVV